MANTDHLGRQTATTSPKAQTVTQFAVEQGTLPKDDASVQQEVKAEQERAKAATARAERVSEQMAPADATPVPVEEGGGQG